MKGWLVVFIKEVRENLRDRRVLLSALLYGPLVGPILFAALTGFIIARQQELSDKTLELPVVGVEHAPNFVRWLAAEGVKIEPPPADAEAAVRDQLEDVVLRIPADYGERWNRGESARLELLYDRSRQQAQTSVGRVQKLVAEYGSQTASLRLRLRGLSPEVAAPVQIVERDVSTPQSRGATLMAMLPYFLVLSAFIGGMYLAIDTTSGERERQSLEPLLITPVPRAQIMAGKMLATAAFALASLLVCVAAFVVSVRFVPVDALGINLRLSAQVSLLIALVVAPVALLAASSQTVVASGARSFREAQTYLQFLVLLPAVPSVLLAVNPMKPELWMYATPMFSQSVLINELVRGDAVSLPHLLVSMLTTVLLALALAWIAVKLYQRERIALST